MAGSQLSMTRSDHDSQRATKIIESNPHDLQASLLAEVVRALESGKHLPLSSFHHTGIRTLHLRSLLQKEPLQHKLLMTVMESKGGD